MFLKARISGLFLWAILDETEYEMYLKAVFGLDDIESEDSRRVQLRDDDGYATEGCYWIAPLPTE